MTATEQLLRDFAEQGSDIAFREIVERYVDLVHSVALRYAQGDTHAAEDITQVVFSDLARKAKEGYRPFTKGNCALGGWLHRHTCFVASNHRRANRRRQARETMAAEMNRLEPAVEPAWQQLTPILDAAIQVLPDEDRDALFLRFYERRNLRAVGDALGISDDAAQKRISRALDKLRSILSMRGVTLTAAALFSMLNEQAISAAPVNLAGAVSQAALSKVAANSPAAIASISGLFTLLLATTKAKVVLIIASVALIATAIIYRQMDRQSDLPIHARGVATDVLAATSVSSPGLTHPETNSGVATVDRTADTNQLQLIILAADSGKPVPGVTIDYWCWQGTKLERKTLHANRVGKCLIPVPRATTRRLRLTTQIDDFADTTLDWHPDRGWSIPTEYTIRLTRPIAIGGRVVDASGRSVEGAEVGFGHEEAGGEDRYPENHWFGWIATKTDMNGKWRINRIAEEMIRRLSGAASHPEHVRATSLSLNSDASTEKALRAEAYVFKLGEAVVVRGIVVDVQDLPIPNAHVRVGSMGDVHTRESQVAPDGTFALAGCKAGRSYVSAEAPGFAPTTLAVELKKSSEPVRLTLQVGKQLSLRIVDKSGNAVAGARAWLNTLPTQRGGLSDPLSSTIQVEFSAQSDTDGRVIWQSAPERDLSFDFEKTGFMRASGVHLRPGDQEHLIVLSPALIIFGRVTDAATGENVPRFRIACGWPTKDMSGSTYWTWSSYDRHMLHFEGGKFRHVLGEPMIIGIENPGYMFKFEADGYAPLITRVVSPEEGEVECDVQLRAAQTTLVTVLLPNGKPARNADIAFVLPGTSLKLLPGRFERLGPANPGVLTSSDAEGRFRLPADESLTKVIAVHPEGFSDATPAGLAADSTLRLKPWGRIEGTYWVGEKRADGQDLSLSYIPYDEDVLSLEHDAFRSRTDDRGRFVFEQVPPGSFMLMVMQPQKGEMNFRGGTRVAEVKVSPGETTAIEVGRNNRNLTFHLRWPDGFQADANWKTGVSISTPTPWPPLQLLGDMPALMRWSQQPEIKSASSRSLHYRVVKASDGAWKAEDIPPRQYMLRVVFMDGAGIPGPTQFRARLQATLNVPSDPASKSLDLGEILMEPVP